MKKVLIKTAAVLAAAALLGGCGQESVLRTAESGTPSVTAAADEQASSAAKADEQASSAVTANEQASSAVAADERNGSVISDDVTSEDSVSSEAVDSDSDTMHTKDVFAMDTYMSIGAYGSNGEKAVEAGEQEIYRLDALLSTGRDTSEVAEINRNGHGTLSADGIALMKESLELYRETDGRFDISIYPVMDLWGFTTENYRVPSDAELAEALSKVDASKIRFDEKTGKVSFEIKGMEIDFGGIAKGYTSSRLMDIYKENGVTSGLVNLGGNVQALGTKPDGSKWRVAIENPDEDGTYLGIAEIADTAVITSGGYERYFEENGKTYHHIIDPSTGYPAESGLLSATVICPDGTLADGLSTSLFIMGEETAAEFWRAHQDEFQMILETEDKELYVTEGLKDSFTSDYTIHYIGTEE